MRRSKRTHSKGADRGGYTFDLGKIAFADPMNLVGKASKQRKKAAATWRAKKTGGEEARNNYHRKHG